MLAEYKVVERVVETKQPETAAEMGDVLYFCKWQGLTYDQCTWESGTVISRLYVLRF